MSDACRSLMMKYNIEIETVIEKGNKTRANTLEKGVREEGACERV